MTSRSRVVAALSILVLAASFASAGEVRFEEKSGRTVTVPMPERATDRVIIEFRERRAAAVESLQRRLETDLARIHDERPGKVRAQSADRIEHRYRVAFSGVSARVDRNALPAIRALSYVKAVYPDRKVQATLERSVPHIGVPQVWEQYHTRGQGITVAIVDTGIDYRHEAFGNRVAGGWDFINDDDDPMDDNGHGTHVAGIVAGSVAPVLGIAPEATLVAYKVLGSDGYGADSGILAALEKVVDPNGDGDTSDHADVVNMSLGRGPAVEDPLVEAVETATAAGVVFCISAGNEGVSFGIGSPGLAPSAITAGATDNDDQLAWFSSRGPALNTWGVKPEVTAPGVDIVSAAVGGGTWTASGTSMASPHVAGLATLVRELHPDWTPAEVKAAVVSTAVPLESVIAEGAGRIDAPHAMAAVVLPSPVALSFGSATPGSTPWSATRTFRLTNRGASAQLLTLTAPAPAGTTMTITPASLVLAPGASAEIRAALAIDFASAALNDNGFAATGAIDVAAGATSLRVPWMLVAGDVVVATYRGDGDALVAVLQGGSVAAEGYDVVGAPLFAFGAKADVFVLTSPLNEGEDKQRIIVRESLDVHGPTIIDIDPAEAKYDLVLASVSETGELLSTIGDPSRGGVWWSSQIIDLPSGVRGVFGLEKPVAMSPLATTKVSAVEHEVHLTPVRQDGKWTYASGAHIVAHGTLTGLAKTETLAIGASDWTLGKFPHSCAEYCEDSVVLGIGAYGLTYIPFGGSFLTRQGTIGVAGQTADGAQPWVMFPVTEQDHPQLPFTESYTLLSPRFVARDGRMVAQLSANPWPLDYTPPAGDDAIPFGYGPTLLRTTMGIHWDEGYLGRPGDDWAVKVTPTGMIGEELADDSLRVQIAMIDSAGRRNEGVRMFSDNYRLDEVLGSGAHRLEITERYRIGDGFGTGTLVSTIDKATKATAPSLTAMRIENHVGRATYLLQPAETARLVFSGRQSWYVPFSSPIYGPIVPESTKVSWRQSPDAEWRALPVSFLGTDESAANDPIGSMFSVDLSPITAIARGAVALRFELTSPEGVTTSWTLEPAFFVESGRRRSAQ